MVGAERIAAPSSLLTNIGERVGLTTEVQETGGESCVEERSEGLLLACKKDRS